MFIRHKIKVLTKAAQDCLVPGHFIFPVLITSSVKWKRSTGWSLRPFTLWTFGIKKEKTPQLLLNIPKLISLQNGWQQTKTGKGSITYSVTHFQLLQHLHCLGISSGSATSMSDRYAYHWSLIVGWNCVQGHFMHASVSQLDCHFKSVQWLKGLFLVLVCTFSKTRKIPSHCI